MQSIATIQPQRDGAARLSRRDGMHFVTPRHWPFYLIFIGGRGIVMDYLCAKFGDFSFSRFGFSVDQCPQLLRSRGPWLSVHALYLGQRVKGQGRRVVCANSWHWHISLNFTRMYCASNSVLSRGVSRIHKGLARYPSFFLPLSSPSTPPFTHLLHPFT